jgi:hypothetical protein
MALDQELPSRGWWQAIFLRATDALRAQQADALHQVNQVVAQSKIRGHLVNRPYPRHFDLGHQYCWRVLRMCYHRGRDRHSADK